MVVAVPQQPCCPCRVTTNKWSCRFFVVDFQLGPIVEIYTQPQPNNKPQQPIMATTPALLRASSWTARRLHHTVVRMPTCAIASTMPSSSAWNQSMWFSSTTVAGSNRNSTTSTSTTGFSSSTQGTVSALLRNGSGTLHQAPRRGHMTPKTNPNYFKRAQRGLFAGKQRGTGNKVSFSNRKYVHHGTTAVLCCASLSRHPSDPFDACRTRRTWLPNVQKKRLFSDILNRHLRLNVTTAALRWIDKVMAALCLVKRATEG